MRFQGTISKIQTSRRGRTMTIALAPNCSLDELENCIDNLCEFEVGVAVQNENEVIVNAVTGEVVG